MDKIPYLNPVHGTEHATPTRAVVYSDMHSFPALDQRARERGQLGAFDTAILTFLSETRLERRRVACSGRYEVAHWGPRPAGK
jgi:hypothetical protein